MITNNYKKLAATMLLATPGASWWLSHGHHNKLCTLVNTEGGEVVFRGWYGDGTGKDLDVEENINFPAIRDYNIWNGYGSPYGIMFGYDSSGVPASSTDYIVGNPIGVSHATASFYDAGTDEQGNPYITIRCTLDVSSGFFMNEIGYAVLLPDQYGASYTESVLLDRTILDSVIQADGENPLVIDYTLKAIWN